MNEQFLTLGYLKKFIDGILILNKNNASRYTDDYIVTYEDIETEKFCRLYKHASKIKNSVDGLSFDSLSYKSNENVLVKDIQLIYCSFSSLKIEMGDCEVSPGGETIDIATYGIYKLNKKTYEETIVLEELNEKVNAMMNCDDVDWFNLDENVGYVSENLTDSDRSVQISAKYSFKAKTFKTQTELIQKANIIGDWEFDSDKTDYIKAIGINNVIPREGGKCIILVKRYFTKYYIKKDLCGEIRDRKEEPNNVEPVTNFCQFSITNNKYFQRIVNTVIAREQEIEGEERTCKVTVTYESEFTDEVIVTQEKGGKLGYCFSLSFDNDEKYLTHNIDSSLKTILNFPLKSLKNLTIDGKITSSIYSYNLSCISDKGWCVPTIIDENNQPTLNVNVVNGNVDKNCERDCNITIFNNEDTDNKITLYLTQSNNKVISVKYEILSKGYDTLTYAEISSCKIYFKMKKTTKFEDGSISHDFSLSDKANKIICSYESTCPTILDGQELTQVDFDGTYVMSPIHYGSTSVSDINLNIKTYICDKDLNRISDFNLFHLTLLGEDLITYEYNFNFDNENMVYGELFFDYDFLNGKDVKLISTKDKYINGIKDSTYVTPFDYNFITQTDDYKVFRKANSTVEIVPTSINMEKVEHSSIIEFKQNESGKVIQMSIIRSRMPDERYLDVHVSVEAFRSFVADDVWADYDSKLIVSDMSGNVVKSILLNKWWLTPEINFNHDIVFDGTIKLIEGREYKFEVKNLISKDSDQYSIEKNEKTEIHRIKDGEDINIFLEI